MRLWVPIPHFEIATGSALGFLPGSLRASTLRLPSLCSCGCHFSFLGDCVFWEFAGEAAPPFMTEGGRLVTLVHASYLDSLHTHISRPGSHSPPAPWKQKQGARLSCSLRHSFRAQDMVWARGGAQTPWWKGECGVRGHVKIHLFVTSDPLRILAFHVSWRTMQFLLT